MFALAVGLYSLSTAYGLRLRHKGFQRGDWITYMLVLAGGLVHTVALLLRGFALGRCPTTNLYEAIVFVGWGIAAAYVLVGLAPRFRFLGVVVAPWLVGLGVLALMPGLDAARPWPGVALSLGTLHRTFILLAFGSFGLGAGAGLMWLLQDYDLKFAVLRALRARLPAIEGLELTVRWSLGVGLGLLTVGLGLGMAYLNRRRGVWFSADPVVLYAAGVWLWYAGLVVGPRLLGAHGRRLAWAAVASFALVALTFWGFYLLSPLHRPPAAAAPAGPLACQGFKAGSWKSGPALQPAPAPSLVAWTRAEAGLDRSAEDAG